MDGESGELTGEKMWQEHEQAGKRQRDWNEVDRVNQKVDSRDEVDSIKVGHKKVATVVAGVQFI